LMILHLPYEAMTLLLLGEGPEHLPKVAAQWFVQHLASRSGTGFSGNRRNVGVISAGLLCVRW